MESDQEQIVVWVCQEEKIVCGLTKHTTCTDVVEALLEEHQTTNRDKSLLLGDPCEYCIVEKWKSYERVLPPVTKMLKLWKAWGKEQLNVHFVLVKSNTSPPIPLWRTAEAKVISNVERQRDLGPVHYIKTLPVDKQKRIVRKAFRKLAKIRHEVPQDRDSMETLMHLILSQDHTIHQQMKRIKELDAEIEAYEASLHLDREGHYGEDYVQNAYLLIGSNTVETELHKLHHQKQAHNTPISKTDAILCMEEELKYHKLLIENLSAEIEAEIQTACLETTGDIASGEGTDEPEKANLEGIKNDLEKSMKSGLKIHSHLKCIQNELSYSDSLLQKKVGEHDSLTKELSSLDIGDIKGYRICPSGAKASGVTANSGGEHYLSSRLTNLDINDTDSDTGISSTHSQDSEPTAREVILLST
ncbi:ras association domain-containing protein 9 isoform X2 [Lissotriton helveticus]